MGEKTVFMPGCSSAQRLPVGRSANRSCPG